MVKHWISNRIERARWSQLGIWFAALFVFSFWAFGMESPWTLALDAGGGLLPETQPGLPAIEPQRSLERLGDATSAYLLWQLIDIPYAVMNTMVASIGMGLALKALKWDGTPLRFLLVLPLIYLGCELIENALVALFASGLASAAEPTVLLQQLATTLKFSAGLPGLLLGAVGAVIAAIAALLRKLR